jgi:Domain of unknown function (DUF892)
VLDLRRGAGLLRAFFKPRITMCEAAAQPEMGPKFIFGPQSIAIGTNPRHWNLRGTSVQHTDGSMPCGPWMNFFAPFSTSSILPRSSSFKTLPKLAKNSANEKLQEAFINHHNETEEQVARLEKVFEVIGEKARGKRCDAILGIVAEGQKVIDEVVDEALRDVGMAWGNFLAWMKRWNFLAKRSLRKSTPMRF